MWATKPRARPGGRGWLSLVSGTVGRGLLAEGEKVEGGRREGEVVVGQESDLYLSYCRCEASSHRSAASCVCGATSALRWLGMCRSLPLESKLWSLSTPPLVGCFAIRGSRSAPATLLVFRSVKRGRKLVSVEGARCLLHGPHPVTVKSVVPACAVPPSAEPLVSALCSHQGAMCVAYTALLNGQMVVLKTPLPDTSHAAVAANDLEVRGAAWGQSRPSEDGWCKLLALVVLVVGQKSGDGRALFLASLKLQICASLRNMCVSDMVEQKSGDGRALFPASLKLQICASLRICVFLTWLSSNLGTGELCSLLLSRSKSMRLSAICVFLTWLVSGCL